MERGLHLGAQMYISRNGEPLLDAAFGHSAHDEGRPRPMRIDDLTIWMSSSKPLGAVAIAQLWERDELDLDAPIAEIIPEFSQGRKNAITMRHVLTHTGGFRNTDLPDPAMNWEEALGKFCAIPLEENWIPGKRAGYHTRSAWHILAEVVQRVSKMPYRDYVRTQIFGPLRMRDCFMGMSSAEFQLHRDRIAPLYKTAGGARDPQHWHEGPLASAVWPAGGARGPIRELGRFYEVLLDGGRTVLRPDTVRELTRPHRVGMFDETFGHTIDFGLGFILDSKRYGMKTIPYGYGDHCSERAFGHGGAESSSAFADPEHGVVVAVFFNGQCGDPRHNKRIREFASAVYEDLGLAG